MRWGKSLVIGISSMVLTLAATAGVHAASLVTNGGFESTTNGPAQFDSLTQATDWTSTGYNFIFAAGTADTIGDSSEFGTNDVQLWGPNNGSNNGLPAASPAGGNFVASDGDFQQGPIFQTINGLTAGNTYSVGFYWGAAQQAGFTGPSTEQWQVSLGAQTLSTSVIAIASEGFSGWMYQTFNFTADNTSDVLSFFANGTPVGVPTFALLDGVTLSSVPLPTTLSLGFFAMLGLWAVRVRKAAKTATV
jgi:hypothetical protein